MTPFTVAACVGDADSASGTDLAISSDGRSIAYQAGQDLWIAPIGGCGMRVTTSISASKPAWSPDGSRLAFQGLTDESGGIYVVSANGTGLRQLTAGASNDTDPAWAPDGAFLAWTHTADSVGRLWVMHADGSGQRQLPIGNAGERLDHPIWIPEAELIPSPSATPAVPNPFQVDGTYPAESLGLDRPIAMAVGPDGHVYMTDMKPSVTVFDAFGSRIAEWGSAGSGRGEFNFGTDEPHGSIAVDSSSRVYVSDSLNARVQVFDATGKFLRQFGSPGTADGEFVWPFDLSVDDQGNVYVLDDGARNLQKFSPDGKFIWKVDNSTLPDFTGHGHDANIDPQGRIVIGIDDNGRVIFLDEDGHEVDAFNAGACQVTVDSAGNIYVADVGCGGETVAVFDPSHRLIGRWQGPAMPLAGAPEFGSNGEVFALGKDGSLIKLAIHLSP
ncbi:MAG: 6-bladed beta-propeller [Chloroflexota bacterium]